MLRVITEEKDIIRVPFSFTHLPFAFFEREALISSIKKEITDIISSIKKQITDIISSIKKIKENASDPLNEEKSSHAKEAYQEMCEKLKIAAG